MHVWTANLASSRPIFSLWRDSIPIDGGHLLDTLRWLTTRSNQLVFATNPTYTTLHTGPDSTVSAAIISIDYRQIDIKIYTRLQKFQKRDRYIAEKSISNVFYSSLSTLRGRVRMG